MDWWSRARRVRGWTPAEWALLAEAWMALLWAWWALRRWPLPEVLARLKRTAKPTAAPVASEPIVRAVLRAVHLFPKPLLCLPQSLAIARLLARRGQPCTLVMGARLEGDALDAHAWVEQDGQPINSPPDSEARHPVLLREDIGGEGREGPSGTSWTS